MRANALVQAANTCFTCVFAVDLVANLCCNFPTPFVTDGW